MSKTNSAIKHVVYFNVGILFPEVTCFELDVTLEQVTKSPEKNCSFLGVISLKHLTKKSLFINISPAQKTEDISTEEKLLEKEEEPVAVVYDTF